MRGLRDMFGPDRDSAPADMPPPVTDRPVYAVGDIHGRMDLLEDLLGLIDRDARINAIACPQLVFLGDYIDRGEDSARVLEHLMALKADARFEPVFLMGNHERMLLDFLADPAAGPRWLHNGGLQTLLSFGIGSLASLRPDSDELDRLSRAINAALRGDTIRFLSDLRLSHSTGNVFFCHAGTDPNRALDQQLPSDLLWRRCPASDPPREDGTWIVHGHTPVDAPSAQNGRLDIDTGAYFSGILTAVRLFKGQAGFLST